MTDREPSPIGRQAPQRRRGHSNSSVNAPSITSTSATKAAMMQPQQRLVSPTITAGEGQKGSGFGSDAPVRPHLDDLPSPYFPPPPSLLSPGIAMSPAPLSGSSPPPMAVPAALARAATASDFPAFAPVFALVTNSTTRSTHHPRVHYVFSDDDPELLAQALGRHQLQNQAAAQRRSLATVHRPQQQQQYRRHRQGGGTGDSGGSREWEDDAEGGAGVGTGVGSSGGSAALVPERAVVLDLVPSISTGAGDPSSGSWEVAWAASLSSDWAVVGASIGRMADGGTAAPSQPRATLGPEFQQLPAATGGLGNAPGSRERSGDGADGVDDAGGGGQTPGVEQYEGNGAMDGGARPSAAGTLVLRIDGVEPLPRPVLVEALTTSMAGSGELRQSRTSREAIADEDYPPLLDEFDRRLSLLRRVVDAGDERIRRQREAEAAAEQQLAAQQMDHGEDLGVDHEGDRSAGGAGTILMRGKQLADDGASR